MTSLLTTEDIMHAITEDGLEPPDLLSWRHWQTWRAGDGRRPAVRRGDAVSTTIAQESTIWRAVMEAVHGPDWYAELRGGAGQPNGSQLDGSQIDGSQVEAGADDVPAAEIAQERQSAAGTQRSIGAEAVSDGCPSAPALRQRLIVPINPSIATVVQLEHNIRRIAMMLDNVGEPVAEQDLVEIVSRGEYVAEVHALARDSQVTCLTVLFNAVLGNDGMSEEERTGRSRALIELLRV